MRKKRLFSCAAAVLFCCCAAAAAVPASPGALDAGRFQDALHQQNFYTILTSIEERLRSLDNVYAMQLSQTLENKLDLYNRKLETLDVKIIRLEALVMLNLDKISENISTKNFKDDIAKTSMFRKMDSIYEGVSHRLNYMERKYDGSFAKIQSKIDATLDRFEKTEEVMTTRDSDIEAELSDAIYAIDDLKATFNAMEEKLLNITKATINTTRDHYDLLLDFRKSSKISVNKLHDNIIESLKYMDDKTTQQLKMTEESNKMLKTMKVELKEDFNNYANKVADMNSDIWKNSDTTGDDLKSLAVVVNSTNVELQNGVRSLMLQIGKLVNKENVIPLETNGMEEINKTLKANFEKIIANQDMFFESCHRVQMDEAQIESEISTTLMKLIDMVENRLSSEKDVKNVEKAIKAHDSRMNRNLHQANTNIISLFEKSTASDQDLKLELKKVNNDLNALFSFVQSTLNDGAPTSAASNNMKVILDKLNKIETSFKLQNSNSQRSGTNRNFSLDDVMQNQILSIKNTVGSIESKIENNVNNCLNERSLNAILLKYFNKTDTANSNTKNESNDEIDEKTREAIIAVFGTPLDQKNTNTSFGAKLKQGANINITVPKKCDPENNGASIDIRTDLKNCGESLDQSNKINKKKRRRKKQKSVLPQFQIDVRGNFNETEWEYEDAEETTTETSDASTETASESSTTYNDRTLNDAINET